MLTQAQLRALVSQAIEDKSEQGFDTGSLADELAATPDSYDALHTFARRLSHLPLRSDWPYTEPEALEDVRAECDPARATGRIGDADPARIRAAFLARIAGCMLGKPFEIDVSLDEIQAALTSVGEWPLNGYA